MFVRWKRRQLKRPPYDGQPAGHVRYAVLVESKRRGGQPRQRVICHLAHIKERDIEKAVWRLRFWQTVDHRLNELGLDSETRAIMETKLARDVARPSATELSELRRKHLP